MRSRKISSRGQPRRIRSLAALCVLAACSVPLPVSPQVAAKDRLVVLISVDGLGAYYLDDPKAHMPTLRRMAREGATAEGLRGSFPSVTWPNHTTLVTGVEPARHGVIANRYLDRATGEIVRLNPDPLFDKDEIVRAPTVYDAAHDAGLSTAAIAWPASRNAKTLDWTVPECATKALWEAYGTPAWLEELRQENIPVDETWFESHSGISRDWLHARATAQVIRAHHPNLVLVHFMAADLIQHDKGPRTPDAYWALSYLDDRVRDIVEAAGDAGLLDRATFFIVSDHGFSTYTKTLLPNVRLRKEKLIQIKGDEIASRQAYVVNQGGSAFLYILDRRRQAELTIRLKEMFRAMEGIAAVIGEHEFGSLGLNPPSRDPRMPDLLLVARNGYTFNDEVMEEATMWEGSLKGSHGYLPTEPEMHGTLIVWGAGVRRGARLPVIPMVDVAPTIAQLLGVRLEGAEGSLRLDLLE